MVMDNYSYLVTDCKNQKSVLIEPGDAYAVQKVLQMKNIEPDAILVTHKHCLFGDGEILTFGDLKFKTILTPGHTIGHAVFLLDGSGLGIDDSLFSGDSFLEDVCPSTLSEEKRYNPFLKTSDIEILRGVGMINIGDIKHLSYEDRARALSLIREHKDLFNYKL
ncbi:hypothetical protein Btru_027149 [Bulinus truncatus]|nr:hypothetical protein Btru_027149 [Bulinus truncatus]